MLTLAIDTATKVCTIALCRDKEILAEYTSASNNEFDANLLAPCKPVWEHSPQANKFSIDVFPFLSTETPPQR